MTYIKPMNYKEFADYLITLKTCDEVCFACDGGHKYPDEIPEVNDCSSWYFARVIKIEDYDSRFILLDYCGGEEAFAIPINNYKDIMDEDDKEIIPEYLKQFFENCRGLGNIDDIVFVEMKEVDNDIL